MGERSAGFSRSLQNNYFKKEDVVFVLARDVHVRDKLKSMMSKALFLGYKSGKELSTIYASSDIFIFPSTTETFGNVTLEAMAT